MIRLYCMKKKNLETNKHNKPKLKVIRNKPEKSTAPNLRKYDKETQCRVLEKSKFRQ